MIESALLCGMTPDREAEIAGLLHFLRIRAKSVPVSEYDCTLETLIVSKTDSMPTRNEDGMEEILVLAVPQNRIQEILQRFRRHRIRRPKLMCILTPSNSGWTVRELYQELSKEREALQSGETVHEGTRR